MKSEVSHWIRNMKINPEQMRARDRSKHKWFRLRKNKHLMHLSCFKWNWSLNFLSSCWAALKRDEDDDDDRYASFSMSGIEVFPPSIFVSLLRLSLSHIVACRLGNGKKVSLCVAWSHVTIFLCHCRRIERFHWSDGCQWALSWEKFEAWKSSENAHEREVSLRKYENSSEFISRAEK